MNTLLANQSAVTVVFFEAKLQQDLPKKRELKKNFKVSNATYFKRYGIHHGDCTMLLDAIALNRAADDDFRLNCWTGTLASSDILLLDADTYYNSWISLKFEAECIGGFNLNGKCLSELEDLLNQYRNGSSIRDTATKWYSNARNNITNATVQRINDESITKIDLPAIQLMAETYGLKNLRSVSAQIRSWVQRYSWSRNLLD